MTPDPGLFRLKDNGENMTEIDRRSLLAAAAGALAASQVGAAAKAEAASSARWTAERANQWYAKQPWLVGANFVPSTAANQLEMFQADTFDTATIDRELGWAAAIGMNVMRVFLHDLLWQQDPNGFRQRLDTYLSISSAHGIRTMLVLFDSCWNPFPKLGPQPAPVPGIHNSQWVQSPGAYGLQHASQYPRLLDYVADVVGAFANDPRVVLWDVWNEPDNTNGNSYGYLEPTNKVALVAGLLPQAFAAARSASPSQPLSSPLWAGDFSKPSGFNAVQTVQFNESDVLTFHNYGFYESFLKSIQQLKAYGRPVLCSEYMARDAGSIFDTCLPVARAENVMAINWGLVSGKTQTILTWDSWQHPYASATDYPGLNAKAYQVVLTPSGEPPPAGGGTKVQPYASEPPVVWHHDVFKKDGTPYRTAETTLIRTLTGRG
jgi:cellulase (glycosyl hydrolase family 5)